jgi:hypothetical protein
MEDPNKTELVHAEEEELTSEYANNVFFAPNVWDLNILFGELSAVRQAIDWHTSMTLPWAQAKLMAYYLAINIAAHELREGPIKIPASMLPQAPPPPPQSAKDDPNAQALFEMIKEHRQKFIESLR